MISARKGKRAHQIQCLKIASTDSTIEALIMATELETDLATLTSRAGADVDDGDTSGAKALAANRKRMTTKTATMNLKVLASRRMNRGLELRPHPLSLKLIAHRSK